MFMILFERAWEILTQNRRAYLALNALYYGLMILAMIYLYFDHALHDSFLKAHGASFMLGPLTLKAPFDFMQALTVVGNAFMLNLLGSSYGEITLPSFLVPFAGVAIGLYRAVILGIAFSPADPTVARIFLPHLPTLLLEGQAAVLAMLGVYVHGRALLWPETVGQKSRWKAYVEGFRQSGTMYVLIMPVLLISAVYG
ncbi:MAG: hypothetical protein WA821_16245, partial [Anaerolineales bacterium]